MAKEHSAFWNSGTGIGNEAAGGGRLYKVALSVLVIAAASAAVLAAPLASVTNLSNRSQQTMGMSGDLEAEKGPVLVSVTAENGTVGQYEKFELQLELEADYDNPYDPDEIDVRTLFRAPSGKEWTINGFFDGRHWKVRFAADEIGEWSYVVSVTDRNGTTRGDGATFTAVASELKGWVTVSQHNPRFLAHRDGTPFYGVGVAYPWNITEHGLDRIVESGGNLVTYWNGNYDSAGMGGGRHQLESVRSEIGQFDVLKGYRIDELVEWFEERELLMNFVIWPHDSLADKIDWPSAWEHNAYSLLGEAVDFFASEQMWAHQVKLYRYIIARWGYSRSIAIWDLICEINGTDGWVLGDRDAADAWAERIHRYYKEYDPFGRPTKGSMAGAYDNYWDHGYRTFDIADRENYYDLHYRAYAEDIGERWQRYEKPLFIGETGNVTDVITYHNALWVTLANGLASTPVWWEISTLNEEMWQHMASFARFVAEIDFGERRQPLTMSSAPLQLQLAAEVSLMATETDMPGAVDPSIWALPEWANANKDENGHLFSLTRDEGRTVSTRMRFADGGYAQGVVEREADVQDWSVYEQFKVDLYVEHDGSTSLKARPVLFPGGRWMEGGEASDMTLPASEWVTLVVPLREIGNDAWLDGILDERQLARISRWGVKLYAAETKEEAESVTVRIRNPRLTTEAPPVVTVPEASGWLMRGDKTSYGWIVTEHGDVRGKKLTIDRMPPGRFTVRWYDPWAGEFIDTTDLTVEDGLLQLTVPESNMPPDAEQTDRPDVHRPDTPAILTDIALLIEYHGQD